MLWLFLIQTFDATVYIWPKAGGSLHNTNFQAMKGDYSGGFYVQYQTDCRLLNSSLQASIYCQFSVDDINGDGLNEVVVQAADHVCAFKGTDGTPLWFSNLTYPSLDVTPLIEDINNDGLKEVVVVSRTRRFSGTTKIEALRGTDGSIIWSYTLSTRSITVSSPTAYDLDRDGDLDVLVGCNDDTLYALDGSTGSVLWKFPAGGDVRTTPAVDSNLLVFADYAGNVYMLNHSGSLVWSNTLSGNIWASPVMVDVNGLGNIDVIVATESGYVYALNGDDGSIIWSYLASGGIRATPAVGDVDNDSLKEVVIGDMGGNVYILNVSTGTLENSFSLTPSSPIYPYWSLVLADLYPISGLEIVISTEISFRGSPNHLYVYSHTGTRLFHVDTVGDGTTLADVDNDGCVEFVGEREGSGGPPPGTRYKVYDSPTNTGSACAPLGYDDDTKVSENKDLNEYKSAEIYTVSGRRLKESSSRGVFFIRKGEKFIKVIKH